MHTFAVTSVISIDHIAQHNAPERITAGSCGFYTALALATFGADVLYAGVHGSDFDQHHLDILRDAGAAVQTCRLHGATARLDLLYDAHGNIAQARYDEGIGASVTAGDLPAPFWDAANLWIGTSPFSFQHQIASRAAHHQQMFLSPQGEWKGRAIEVLAVVPHLAYLLMNQRELAELGFGGFQQTLAALYAANPRLNLVITRSKRGAWLLTPHALYAVPAAPDPVIADTTGAGDTFNAAFVFQTICGAAPQAALQWATAAAALSMRDYAYFGLPASIEVNAYLNTISHALPVEVIPYTLPEFPPSLRVF